MSDRRLRASTALTELPADVFLPYQQRLWQASDFYDVVVVEKSRRTGYSWALGAIAAMKAALSKADGGSDVLYMGYEREMTREFIDYVADWAKTIQAAAIEVEEFVFNDPDRPDKNIGAFRIRFASGFEVIALPSVARALRGKQGLVILDEAAFMDDLAEVLKSAFALLIWGGKVIICSTHNGDTNPFNVLVDDVRAGRLPYHLERCTFDEAVAEGLCRRTLLKQGLPWSPEAEAAWVTKIRGIYSSNADEELDVIPSPSTGTYLPGTLLEARAVAGDVVARWECPHDFAQLGEVVRINAARQWCDEALAPLMARLDRNRAHVVGEDFGRIRDLTVMWVLEIGNSLVRRTPMVIELRNVPFEQQRQILFWLCDRLPRLRAMAMDAGGNGMYLAEVAMQRYGALVQGIQLSEPWYRENMPPVKAALEDEQLELPADDEVLGDLRMLKLVRGVARIPERRLTDDKKHRHGDAAIALALAFAASREDPEEYGYLGAPARHLQAGAGRYDDEGDRFRRVSRQLRGGL